MAGPVAFLRGLVGASPSQSPESVKSKKVGRYNHRTAEAVEGKPLLRNSKEYYTAEAKKLEEQAGRLLTNQAKAPKLEKAEEMRRLAANAQTNDQLHANKQRAEAKKRMAEIEKNNNAPLNKIKKAADNVANAIKQEAKDIVHDAKRAVRLVERDAKVANETDVMNKLIDKRKKIKWYKQPAESFTLWRKIREQRVKIAHLNNKKI
ncbi:hypothetical protein [Endozoicomonas sp. 4G]|uniref:hypothetical protein n=1 Tax=Endozoicomonas sp. 4G TaxID=2872754 RepID=UPI0020790195|nr:hypothetical protein [Endozoicomonas sp. 4G]